MHDTEIAQSLQPVLEAVAQRARNAGTFGDVRIEDGMLVCDAANAAEPAMYRVEAAEGRIWVSLVTPNRWLSESIESDLMHTGDSLEELLDEELADLDYRGKTLPFEHFRSDDMLFTFRSPLPVSPTDTDAADIIATCLLAYEACFRQLGDMDESDDDD